MWALIPIFGYVIKKLSESKGSSPLPQKTTSQYKPIKNVTKVDPQVVPTKSQIEAIAKQEFKAKVRVSEGYVLKVYLDTRGILTAGIGHKILPSDNLKLGDPVTVAQVMAWFEKDTATAFNAAKSQAADIGRYTVEFLAALAEVNYQLGTNWKAKFYNTYNLLKTGQYQLAISNLRQSAWIEQTPERVHNFIVAINKTFQSTAKG